MRRLCGGRSHRDWRLEFFGTCSRQFLLVRTDAEEPLPEFNRMAVLNVDLDDLAGNVGLDFVHELHCFDNAKHRTLFDDFANLDIGLSARRRRAIERADYRRGDGM